MQTVYSDTALPVLILAISDTSLPGCDDIHVYLPAHPDCCYDVSYLIPSGLPKLSPLLLARHHVHPHAHDLGFSVSTVSARQLPLLTHVSIDCMKSLHELRPPVSGSDSLCIMDSSHCLSVQL